MGKRNPKRRNRKAKSTGDAIDYAKVEAWATLEGHVRVDDLTLPMVSPRQPVEDHMEFDRTLCKLGIKAFVRRAMRSDWDYASKLKANEFRATSHLDEADFARGEAMGYVVISEASPGIRIREAIQVFPQHTLN